MTHNNPLVIDSAEFFARVAFQVLGGQSPTAALEEVSATRFSSEPWSGWIKSAQNKRSAPTIKTIFQFGQSCDTRGAFPAVIHLITRYENNLQDALIENVMAGGDSAARGMVVGMILGAHLGMKAIPGIWLDDMTRRSTIEELLNRIERA
jgi:ADP-ribosylglycohydrolase